MSSGLRYLATTVALLAVGLGYTLIQGRTERPAPRPAAQPRTVGRPLPLAPALPTAREILDRRAALGLSAEQVVRLEALDSEWRAEAAPLETALQAAGEEFSGFVREAQAGKGASVQEIQRQSAEYRELSATLRERRQLHSEGATRALTESQRQQLAAAGATGTLGGGR